MTGTVKASAIDTENLLSRKIEIKTGGKLISTGKTSYNDTAAGLYIDKDSIAIYKDAD